MANITDAVLARYQAEIEEKKVQMDGILEGAQSDGRDVTAPEMELFNRHKDRMAFLETQAMPLRDAARISADSSRRSAELVEAFAIARNPGLVPGNVEYRSFGAYAVDVWQAMQRGGDDSARRLEMYHRAAAHQTTGDNPGLIPEQLLGPVLNFVDASRPIVATLGPRNLPSGSFSRPHITQHTQVDKQTGEKTELASRKMIIGKIPVPVETFGGYVNVSMQNRDWSTPQVVDIVTSDLALQYAIETEAEAGAVFRAGATAGGGTGLPATPTAVDVGNALWSAIAQIVGAVPGATGFASFVSPDVAAKIGPLFVPVNPANSLSTGFSAANFGSGTLGTVAGVPIVMSPGLVAKTMLVVASVAAEVYEDRLGPLSVTEPSVLGVQVGYAGYFAPVIIEAGGIVGVTVA